MFKITVPYAFQRHPLAVTAFFRRSLVLTYAFPAAVLQPLLPPGLALDTCGEFGFLAIALVQTTRLRPSIAPEILGRDCFLSGYRIFTRLGTTAGSLRGLRILRSDTNRRWMVFAGNLLTHYQYRLCQAQVQERGSETEWRIRTKDHEADLHVISHADDSPPLPQGSPFANHKDARRFAGPLPYTFDYEPQTHSMIRIRGVRQQWNPQPVNVDVKENTFLNQPPFCGTRPILANAFQVENVPYRWERGVRCTLSEPPVAESFGPPKQMKTHVLLNPSHDRQGVGFALPSHDRQGVVLHGSGSSCER